MGKGASRISQAPGFWAETEGEGPLSSAVRSPPVNDRSTFADRHIGPNADDIATMLTVIGVDSLDELAAKAVPTRILDALRADVAPGLDGLPPAATEEEALAEMRRLADTNTVAVSMIGQGYFDTLTPAVLRRNIVESPAWYTAYTPWRV